MRSKTVSGSLKSEGERTLEVRWFLRAPQALQVETLQTAPPRTDWYAPPAHNGCNIKLREGLIETKIRAAEYGVQPFGASVGRIEEWVKWGCQMEMLPEEPFLRLGGFRPIIKTRHTAFYQLREGGVVSADSEVANGCQFEYSELQINGDDWWTIGFEAFGEDLAPTLRAVTEMISREQTLQLSGNQSCGYPQFLRENGK